MEKLHVNVPKSHLSLQYNFKRNTLRNIKRISHCNDESIEPTSSTESIFDIIGTLEEFHSIFERFPRNFKEIFHKFWKGNFNRYLK